MTKPFRSIVHLAFPHQAKALPRLAMLITTIGVVVAAPLTTRGLAKTGQVSEGAIDPNAIAALKKMSAYLRSLKSFQVLADVTNDAAATGEASRNRHRETTGHPQHLSSPPSREKTIVSRIIAVPQPRSLL